MFENLTHRFTEVFKNLRGHGKITEKNIDEAVKQVKLALLEADVNYKVVKKFIQDVKEKSLGRDVLSSVLPDQQFVKIVNDELVMLMKCGDDQLRESNIPPTIIMLVGLQGVGKTTVAAKLALYLSKQNKKVLLTACDVNRPAAVEQLRVLAGKVGCNFYGNEKIDNSVKMAENSLDYARAHSVDYIILDTAGRLEVNDELMNELREMKYSIKPHEVMFVADAMMGQTSVDVAKVFHDAVGLDGIFISKLDGDARGGVALSVKSVIGCPIKFVGVGEKLEDIEFFFPDRMASRILGMGDVIGFVEKAQVDISEEHAKKLEKKIKTKGLDLNDFVDQIRQIKKMGSLKDLISLLPGANKMKNMTVDDNQLVKIEAIICSMTQEEKANPHIINGSRRKRIAKGSGTSMQDVNKLLKQFDMMNKMMKKFSKSGMPKGFGDIFS